METQVAQKRVHGEYAMEHLRPSADPEKQAKFWPLWDERCRVQEDIAGLESNIEALAIPVSVGIQGSKKIPHTLLAPVRAVKAWLESLSAPFDVLLEQSDEYLNSINRLRSLRAREAELTQEMRQYQDLLHAETFSNVVTDVGALDLLDKYMKGSAYTQTIRMGLKGTGTAVVGDTQASHAGWLEQGLANAPTYTGNRKDVTMNSATGAGAGSRSSASPTQAFAITSTGTVHGCFINNGGSSTKDNTTGILFSAGDFTGGSRAVINGDTLNVTYTLTL